VPSRRMLCLRFAAIWVAVPPQKINRRNEISSVPPPRQRRQQAPLVPVGGMSREKRAEDEVMCRNASRRGGATRLTLEACPRSLGFPTFRPLRDKPLVVHSFGIPCAIWKIRIKSCLGKSFSHFRHGQGWGSAACARRRPIQSEWLLRSMQSALNNTLTRKDTSHEKTHSDDCFFAWRGKPLSG
jgi:hypothetical protein